MKKLFMMAAAAMMAAGAWADIAYSYTWTLDINNLDGSYTFPSDLQIALYGTDGTQLAVLQVGMYGSDYNLAKDDDGNYLANNYAKANGLKTTYTQSQLTLNGDSIHTGKQNMHLTADFKTTDNLYQLYNSASGSGTSDSLYAVLSGTTSGGKKYQNIDVSWTSASGTMTFAGATDYNPTPIPEPTSGLMVLMGLMGLALKRKRG